MAYLSIQKEHHVSYCIHSACGDLGQHKLDCVASVVIIHRGHEAIQC